jgi:hypothetical protein
MGQVTTLSGLIEGLGSLDQEATIYAAEPWTGVSRAIVAREPESGGFAAEAQSLGLKYFLEVAIARDFLDGWATSLGRHPSNQERCARLIQYAVNDA